MQSPGLIVPPMTAGGEIEFDDCYENYALVDVAAIGFGKRENLIKNHAKKGDIVVLMGGQTGRDGMGGSQFASDSTPNDSDGHGSHTAATTAGNVVLGATLHAPTTSLSRDISGVAPHANIIAYDVCVASCPGAALLAAINQVLVDAGNLPNGIAALNYSISGGGDPYNDPVELGFLNAVAAGVYVSASAGNAGPGPSTVAHLGPWVSTTAASTHNRQILNELIDLTTVVRAEDAVCECANEHGVRDGRGCRVGHVDDGRFVGVAPDHVGNGAGNVHVLREPDGIDLSKVDRVGRVTNRVDCQALRSGCQEQIVSRDRHALRPPQRGNGAHRDRIADVAHVDDLCRRAPG